jgi:hypothetical protein
MKFAEWLSEGVPADVSVRSLSATAPASAALLPMCGRVPGCTWQPTASRHKRSNSAIPCGRNRRSSLREIQGRGFCRSYRGCFVHLWRFGDDSMCMSTLHRNGDQWACRARGWCAELTRRCARMRSDASVTIAMFCAMVFCHQMLNPSVARLGFGILCWSFSFLRTAKV